MLSKRVKNAVSKEIHRQGNEYAALMLKEKDANMRKFYHCQHKCNNFVANKVLN